MTTRSVEEEYGNNSCNKDEVGIQYTVRCLTLKGPSNEECHALVALTSTLTLAWRIPVSLLFWLTYSLLFGTRQKFYFIRSYIIPTPLPSAPQISFQK